MRQEIVSKVRPGGIVLRGLVLSTLLNSYYVVPAYCATEQAISSNAFIDSIGVNINTSNSTTNAYWVQNHSLLYNAISGLGVRHVRALPHNAHAEWDILTELQSRFGVMATVGPGIGTGTIVNGNVTSWSSSWLRNTEDNEIVGEPNRQPQSQILCDRLFDCY